jgi:omega-hydroxy-beta-dihydromenaquinone-9 sulfotransferase
MQYHKRKENILLVTKEPLAGANLSTIFRLLIQNKFHISFSYLPRILYSIFLSSMLLPFRRKEHKTYNKTIKEYEVKHHPLFLLGHWRSGTTFLHNVLSKDNQFGFLSTFDAYLPGVFLSCESFLKPLVAMSIPSKRPMDNVAMNADFPQEDEYALGGSCVYSYYHGWCFPRNMGLYNQYVLFDRLSAKTKNDFKNHYSYLIKKASIKTGGKRLLLKNPSNTARIKILLDLFPDAKFIHIQRNPYHQYLSMMRFMKMVIPLYCVQTPPAFKEVEDLMMELYVQMYTKYFNERKLIPKGNLIEIRYEDFIVDPFLEINNIYVKLGLLGFEGAERSFKAYILSQSEIKTADYEISKEIRDKVYNKWKFIFEKFGYDY